MNRYTSILHRIAVMLSCMSSTPPSRRLDRPSSNPDMYSRQFTSISTGSPSSDNCMRKAGESILPVPAQLCSTCLHCPMCVWSAIIVPHTTHGNRNTAHRGESLEYALSCSIMFLVTTAPTTARVTSGRCSTFSVNAGVLGTRIGTVRQSSLSPVDGRRNTPHQHNEPCAIVVPHLYLQRKFPILVGVRALCCFCFFFSGNSS